MQSPFSGVRPVASVTKKMPAPDPVTETQAGRTGDAQGREGDPLALVQALRETVQATDLPQDREGLRSAVDARIRAALPSISDDEIAVVWMQPSQFSLMRTGDSETASPHKTLAPAACVEQSLRRVPAHRLAVVAVEWGVHSVAADVHQVRWHVQTHDSIATARASALYPACHTHTHTHTHSLTDTLTR